jgi:Ni/Co efflux regulator RcnB
MKNMKRFARTLALAVGLSIAAPMAAHAGEWRIDARKCPDLREDRRDARHNDGWRDRREDRRDQRVINCPSRAWYYVKYRGERGAAPPRPRDVYIERDGRHYYRDYRGNLVNLSIGVNLRG